MIIGKKNLPKKNSSKKIRHTIRQKICQKKSSEKKFVRRAIYSDLKRSLVILWHNEKKDNNLHAIMHAWLLLFSAWKCHFNHHFLVPSKQAVRCNGIPLPPQKKQLHLCDHWNFIHSMTAKHCICIFTIVTLMFCTFCTATLYQFCTNFRLPQASLLRRCDNVWLSFINGVLRFVFTISCKVWTTPWA